MRLFFTATLVYMLAATVLTLVLDGDRGQTLVDAVLIAGDFGHLIFGSAAKVLPLALPLLWWFGHLQAAGRLRTVFAVAYASVMLQVGFLFMKSAIPQIVPFYADPFWAWTDQMLLFGYDAWEIAHAATPEVLASWFPTIYQTMWTLLAYSFPILVVASDHDDRRALRYVWLFMLSWLVTGNLLALAGSSVGPVFYDQLFGTERFAAMRASFDSLGFSSGPIAGLQERLWESSQDRLSFISAFPSVHVAVAGIAALYIRERFGRRWLVGDLFVVLILWISVYSGYHYLVDGLASLAVVLILKASLDRHEVLGLESRPWR